MRLIGRLLTAMLVASLAACAAAPGTPGPVVPTSPPTSAPETPAPATPAPATPAPGTPALSPSAPGTPALSPSASPTALPAPADPTSLRWTEGALPGTASTTDPSVAQEFHVLGWSKGYLGFTSTYSKATGRMQSLLVTASADGLHWHGSGSLDPGGDDSAVVVTQVVEGPAGLLATAEGVGCALHKPAERMWRSADGVSWAPVDLAGVFGADSLTGVSGGAAGYIVLAAAGKLRTVWTSGDGASWHKTGVPSGGFGANSVASFQGGFVVAGTTRVLSPDCVQSASGPYVGSIWLSAHGSPWTSVKLPNALVGTQASMSLYRLNDETLLADEGATVGSGQDATSQQRAWTSSDGLTWQRSDSLLGMDPLTDGTRTVFAVSTDQGQFDIWTLTHDLRLVRLSAGADGPVAGLDGLVALGPAGVVMTDSSGAASWLGVPVP